MQLDMFTFTRLQEVLSEFAPDLIVNHSVIKPVRVPLTCVLHCVSNKCEVSTAFWFRVNRRHGAERCTDRQNATLSLRYKCTLAARQLSKNACSLLVLALCEDSVMLFWWYLNANLNANAQICKIPCSRNNCCISIKIPFTKFHKCRPCVMVCSLCWVNFKTDPQVLVLVWHAAIMSQCPYDTYSQ